MLRIRKANERGFFDHGWLRTAHTFSFADYHDDAHMGFRNLRVINEDRVAPGEGFGTHGHRDMEIITWVMAGALAHKDSLGNGDIIRQGDVQRMSAGRGIMHSEFNASQSEDVHFFQIWILPSKRGIEPSYEQRKLGEGGRNTLKLVAAPAGEGGVVTMTADARLYASQLAAGKVVQHRLAKDRHAWVQVTRGAVELNGQRLEQSDGAAISIEPEIEIKAATDAELLVFDLA